MNFCTNLIVNYLLLFELIMNVHDHNFLAFLLFFRIFAKSQKLFNMKTQTVNKKSIGDNI